MTPFNTAELKTRPIEELRTLAAKHGIKVHHKAKAETIAKLLVESVTTPKVPEHPAQKTTIPMVINTEADVLELIKPFLAKEGFKATFKDDTWHFTCKGSEDSGHMSVPLRTIRMKAETVSRGARNPRRVKFNDEMVLSA